MRNQIHIDLALTKDEAQTLRDILGQCSGSLTLSRNRHAYAIHQALSRVGFLFPSGNPDLVSDHTRIHFHNTQEI